MTRLLLLLVFVVRASSELQLMKYQMHVSRKSRSNVAPLERGYVYSKVNKNPGIISSFGNDVQVYAPQVFEPNANLYMVNNFSDILNKHTDISSENAVLGSAPRVDNTHVKRHDDDYSGYYSSFPKGKNSEKTINQSPPSNYQQEPSVSYQFPLPYSGYSGTEISSAITEHSNLPYSVNYQIAKSEAKYNSKYLPSKIKSDIEIEKLKSAMHYRPSPDVTYDLAYNTFNNFNVDEDDVRTSSRSPYDGWPYFYHSPYEYDLFKDGADNSLQKAIDKRYAVPSIINHKTIPVYEHQEYDKPYNTKYYETTTQDNPISGHQPFFSFVLNDYYEKSGDDDALNFRGVEWGQDFDYGHGRPVVEDITAGHQRLSRQDNTNNPEHSGSKHLNNEQHKEQYNRHEAGLGESSTEKVYKKSHEFVNQEAGDNESSEHEEDYEQKRQNQNHFKDFLDSFTNKFGGENHDRKAKYALERNQDKGEKKKGFRRVYHKDEYQEDNEFYDNTNNKAHVHEGAQSSGHSGGSEAFVKSHATAATGDESNSHSNKGNTHRGHFEKNRSGNNRRAGNDYDLKRYREEAKKAARFNSAEYPDYTLYN